MFDAGQWFSNNIFATQLFKHVVYCIEVKVLLVSHEVAPAKCSLKTVGGITIQTINRSVLNWFKTNNNCSYSNILNF